MSRVYLCLGCGEQREQHGGGRSRLRCDPCSAEQQRTYSAARYEATRSILKPVCCIGKQCGKLFSPLAKTQKYCGRMCAESMKYKIGFRLPFEAKALTCLRCQAPFVSRHNSQTYCSRPCKIVALSDKRTMPLRIAAEGRRQARAEASITRARQKQQDKDQRAACRVMVERKSREKSCPWCSVAYSRLTGRMKHCSTDCAALANRDARQADKRMGKARRRAREAIQCEPVSPTKVFQNDAWRCYLCGTATPKRLRGSYEPNAPEMDHVIPLAKGGAHTYANIRCACRACNGKKADTMPREKLIAMAGEVYFSE